MSSDVETSRRKIHLFGQHWHYAWDLFLCIEAWWIGDRLKLYCHLVVHSGQDVLELQFLSIFADHFTQGLHEPGPARGVPPWVVAYRHMRERRWINTISNKIMMSIRKGMCLCVWVITWGGGEGIQEVSFHRDPSSAILSAVCFNACIQLGASAGLMWPHTQNKTWLDSSKT